MKKETQKKIVTEPETQAPKMARATVKYLRVSPRKVRLVINPIRFKLLNEAFAVLMTLKNKSARMVEKLLKTCAANAKVLGMDEKRLYVAEVRADGGPVMKRFMSRSMGRADRILKRMSHISMVIKEGQRIDSSSSQAGLHQEETESKSSKSKPSTKAAKAGSKKKKAGAAA